MCGDINICNTQPIPNILMYGHFSDIPKKIKTRQKSDSFAVHCEQHFKSTVYCTNLFMCINLNMVKMST